MHTKEMFIMNNKQQIALEMKAMYEIWDDMYFSWNRNSKIVRQAMDKIEKELDELRNKYRQAI
jgi:hypothetical protein